MSLNLRLLPAVALVLVFFPATSIGPAVAGDDLAAAAKKVRQIIAHRGSSADRPENTLASYRRGIEAGATANEADVRVSKDGHLISLHDADVKRTTSGKGLARDLTLAELRSLDAGTWFDKRFKDERIPTLREVLELCKDKIDVVLDLQEASEEYAQRIAAEVRAHGNPRRIIVGVRKLEHCTQFRKLLPEARQLGLIPDTKSIDAFASAGVDTIRLWTKWLGDETLIPAVRRHKLKLHLNGTTGSADETRMLLRYGPDSLASDDPARLVQSLAAIANGK